MLSARIEPCAVSTSIRTTTPSCPDEFVPSGQKFCNILTVRKVNSCLAAILAEHSRTVNVLHLWITCPSSSCCLQESFLLFCTFSNGSVNFGRLLRTDSCERGPEVDGCARFNVPSVESRQVDNSIFTVTLFCSSKFCRPTSWTRLSAWHLEGLDRRVGMDIYASESPAPHPTCCRAIVGTYEFLHKTQLQTNTE
jgi:hypothetical protein